MKRFQFEVDRDGDYNIYDTHESGIGCNNAIGWCDKYNRALFERLLNADPVTFEGQEIPPGSKLTLEFTAAGGGGPSAPQL